jgi:hypothetical protein
MDASLGFFSGFNARHLDAEQVARSFVPSAKFVQLLGLQHSLVIGARGSGKTHMLKMLQPKALNAWQHDDAAAIRQRINYWGIFVPADEAWRQQIEMSASELPEFFQSTFRSSVFATHVQRSTLDCFLQLTHDRPHQDAGFAKVDMKVQQEAELSRTLADSWGLRPRVHSLIGIRQALVDRSADLYELADRPERAKAVLDECQTQPIQAALRGLHAFDNAIGRYEGRWCLMFDELEIAPSEIQGILFRSLRATDQKLIFKLALSPSTQAASIFRETGGPSAGNDFDEISLYSDPKEAAAFCEILWRNLAKGTRSEGLSPVQVLGHSTFHAPEGGNPYAKRGRWQQASSSLARKDQSYVEFAQRYHFDVDALDKASPDLKNSVVRKIGPIVGFREYMLKGDRVGGRRAELRADKTRPAALYSGWEALCLVSEGNPRWFTGIAKALLLRQDATSGGLTKGSQYSAIAAASRKFRDYVATIPSTAKGPNSSLEGGLKALVDLLVERFKKNVLFDDFPLEPVLSFEIDENTSDDLRQAVFDGLYAGAFIPVGDVERQFVFSADLADQRLRITYLLAPLELLPLRSGKSRKLRAMVEGSNGFRRSQPGSKIVIPASQPQSQLFSE